MAHEFYFPETYLKLVNGVIDVDRPFIIAKEVKALSFILHFHGWCKQPWQVHSFMAIDNWRRTGKIQPI